MRSCLILKQMAWVLLVVGCLGLTQAHAMEIDRLLATVNGRVITEGDLLLARELNAVMVAGKAVRAQTALDEVNRLIDLDLLHQELENFPMTQADEREVEARVREIKQTFPGEVTVSSLLARLGMQDRELDVFLRQQVAILRFIDFRFRPLAAVSDQEIQTYYHDKLAPELKGAHLSIPPLPEVSSKIEAILMEVKVNDFLDQWMSEARHNARIEYFMEQAP
jgi:peptidyl-prolyl cis-trans isomerase SurA